MLRKIKIRITKHINKMSKKNTNNITNSIKLMKKKNNKIIKKINTKTLIMKIQITRKIIKKTKRTKKK